MSSHEVNCSIGLILNEDCPHSESKLNEDFFDYDNLQNEQKRLLQYRLETSDPSRLQILKQTDDSKVILKNHFSSFLLSL